LTVEVVFFESFPTVSPRSLATKIRHPQPFSLRDNDVVARIFQRQGASIVYYEIDSRISMVT